jgi:PAS domain S-box-containing protein
MTDASQRIRVGEQLVMHAAGIGTWRYDLAADVFRGDDLARELLGIGDLPGPLSLKSVLRRVHPVSTARLREYLNGKGSHSDTRTIVIRIEAADASDRFVAARARLLPNPTGGAGELVGILMDDTEHQRLEQNLREREKWLQTLVHGVPQSFMYMDHAQRIVFANEIFLMNTGWTGKDVRGKHLSEIHGPTSYAQRTRYIERALAGETVSYEAVGRKGDGRGFFHHEFKPHLDRDGKVVGIFATATDISDRHDMELQLEVKQAELVRSNRDLEQFAYVASHDLKAPLRAIEVLVGWLREDLEDHASDDVHENLRLLGQRTRRLARLLDDLLEYSRAGRKIGKLVQVNCLTLIKDLIDLLAPPKGISIEIDGELPTFTTYSAPLEQVFRNLIGNAIKHHPGPTGTIRISCEESDDSYQFAVADDGAGIPMEFSERVFQMFQTLKPRDEVEGSGMGLAIVSRITEWQGGRVWFTPGPDGRGTVFRFLWNRSMPGQESPPNVEEAICQRAAK